MFPNHVPGVVPGTKVEEHGWEISALMNVVAVTGADRGGSATGRVMSSCLASIMPPLDSRCASVSSVCTSVSVAGGTVGELEGEKH